MRISDWSSDVCSSDLLRRHRAKRRLMPPESTRWVGVLLTGFFPDEAINHSAKHSARYRGAPDKPKLCDGPITKEQRDAGAPRRIHCRIRDGTADPVAERQPQANRDGGTYLRGARVQ